MLERLLSWETNSWTFVIASLTIALIGTVVLYVVLFYLLRSIFRRLESDIALVTLNISAFPALAVFLIVSLKIGFHNLESFPLIDEIESILSAGLIIALSYWVVQLFTQVIIYYLKDYTRQTEVMWDDVLLPLLEAVVPVIVTLISGVLLLQSFGVDLTGIWVTLGGATFVIGFAVKDILANFFSGIVLLIDTPFQFGDVLRLEDGSIGMLRKIGVRVTQLYMFNSHCNVYIPNSTLQAQNITNLSRPTSYYFSAFSLEIPSECDLDEVKQTMEEIVLAHPDTLGDINRKLAFIDKHYQNELEDLNFRQQQAIGKLRLLAEQEVNFKLEEIAALLEALVLTIQFAEKGGLTPDEIQNIQQEFQEVINSIGLKVINNNADDWFGINLEENKSTESLIALVRDWYRVWLKDPNLLDDDQSLISQEWERKINLLKKRVQRLWQKISKPKREETRLDDYVLELITWIKDKFKHPRSQWQEPQIRMTGINHDESSIYIEFTLNFYVDDIKLEDGKRGSRLSSQIYQEIIGHLKNTYPNWGRNQEGESRADNIPERKSNKSILLG
jgi:MscS family membrane protein